MKTWAEFFENTKKNEYWARLEKFWDEEYSKYKVFPKRDNIFNAFKLTPLSEIKVVVLGQDPYHEVGQAMGLAFSVPEVCKLPPSLKNIFKEISLETGCRMKQTGDLTYLAKQGVFLVNTILTVREGQALSHKIKEYDLFIKDLFACLESQESPIVYMLWGGPAQKYKKLITNKNHIAIKRTHPSPLGANRGGWFNCNQFNECNNFLTSKGVAPIDWQN